MENWDDIRIFLAVARHGCLTKAARSLGVNHTTVARRLSGLETSIGTRLVDRSPSGVTLTGSGSGLVEYAERIEIQALLARDCLNSVDGQTAGTVRLVTREAFGTWLVCPMINVLHERHPDIVLELVPEARTFSLLKRDADIAVTMTPPSQDRLYSQKLTDYRLGLFASQDYLKKHGPIKKMEGISQHPLIWYINEMIDVNELRYLGDVCANARTPFRSSTMVAQQVATSSGMGIGILPLFTARLDPRLVRILPGKVELMRTYWLTAHPDSRKVPRVRAVIDFLLDVIRANRKHF